MCVAGRVGEERCQAGPEELRRRLRLAPQLVEGDAEFMEGVARALVGTRRLAGAADIVGCEQE